MQPVPGGGQQRYGHGDGEHHAGARHRGPQPRPFPLQQQYWQQQGRERHGARDGRETEQQARGDEVLLAGPRCAPRRTSHRRQREVLGQDRLRQEHRRREAAGEQQGSAGETVAEHAAREIEDAEQAQQHQAVLQQRDQQFAMVRAQARARTEQGRIAGREVGGRAGQQQLEVRQGRGAVTVEADGLRQPCEEVQQCYVTEGPQQERPPAAPRPHACSEQQQGQQRDRGPPRGGRTVDLGFESVALETDDLGHLRTAPRGEIEVEAAAVVVGESGDAAARLGQEHQRRPLRAKADRRHVLVAARDEVAVESPVEDRIQQPHVAARLRRAQRPFGHRRMVEADAGERALHAPREPEAGGEHQRPSHCTAHAAGEVRESRTHAAHGRCGGGGGKAAARA